MLLQLSSLFLVCLLAFGNFFANRRDAIGVVEFVVVKFVDDAIDDALDDEQPEPYAVEDETVDAGINEPNWFKLELLSLGDVATDNGDAFMRRCA